MRDVKNEISNQIDVGTITLFDLFENNLSIPDFQRPYEWNERLVLKLFQDIDEHFFFENKPIENISTFYLGSILLNKKIDNILEIVDGQQRLTTFLILDYLIDSTNSFLEKNSFFYHSNISVKNILEVRRIIESCKSEFNFSHKNNFKGFTKKILLNIIITTDEQKAFQFFDSLNSKGKKLDTINVLKSYHLRELKDEIKLQKNVASNFDILNAKVDSSNFKQCKIYSLNNFVSLLWVKHNFWTKGNFSKIYNVTIENFFRENSIRHCGNVKSIKLFPGVRNIRNSEVLIGENKNTFKSIYEETLHGSNLIEFNPLQPVQKGLGFFLSLEKLHHYFNFLFIDSEFEILNKITSLVKESFNDYFLHLYYLIILGYYVKFENYRLEEFAFEIEQILGNKLLTLQSVRRESPAVIMRDEFNILQHIYLNIEPNILLTEIVKFKMTIRVQEIHQISKDENNYVVFKFKGNNNKEYLSHTTRPKYIERAKKTYLNPEETNQEFINLSWNSLKLNKSL